MAKRAVEKRYKNVDRQMVHDDLVKASEILGITKSEFLTMCYLERNFDIAMLKERRHPTEYLLRQLSKIIKRSGTKRHWQDYLPPEPKPEPDHQITFTEAWGYPQAEQEPAQESAEQVDPHKIEDGLCNSLCAFARLAISAHNLGYRVRPTFELVKDAAET